MRLAIQPTESPAFIAWEECACPLCNGPSLTPVLDAPSPTASQSFLIVRCNRCGLCYTNPRPDPVSIRQFYPDDYPCHRIKEPSARPDPMQRYLTRRAAGRLLDFGCGSGDFLLRMQTLGWTVAGLDASEVAVERVRARGLPAYVGALPLELWAEPCFEAITMRQSLEHTHQPLEVLLAAQRLLTSGGHLLVAVPNFDSWASHWFGADWFGLDLPRHLTHFTPATLLLMLQRAGFEQIELQQQARASWIRHSAELSERRDRHSRMTRLLKTRLGSSLAGAWGALTGRADSVLAVAVKK